MMDGVRMLADSRLYWFNKLVLHMDWANERIHGPYCDFLTSGVIKKYRKSIVWSVKADGTSDWQYGMDRIVPTPFPPDWTGEVTDMTYPRITQDFGRRYKEGLLPRKAGKTSHGTEGLSLWLPATCDPNSSVMIVFGSQELSDTMGKLIAAHLNTNATFRYLYGKWEKEDYWQERTKTYACRKRQSRTPSLMMTSVGAKITGLHPTFIILDDPIDERNHMSEAALADIEHYHDSLFALDPDFMWVHGTRWGPTDLYGQRIMDQLGDHYDIYVRGARNPDGSLWYPQHFSEDDLKAREKVLGHFLFCSQMLNQCVSRLDNPLRSECIKPFDANNPAEFPNRASVARFLWCDPGGARGTGAWGRNVSDFARNAADDEIHLWVREAIKSGITSAKAAKLLCDLWWIWKPDAWGIENTGFAQAFIDDTLKPEIRRQGIPMRLTETKPGGIAKAARVAGVANSFGTLLEHGCVHIPRDNGEPNRHGIRMLRSEIAMFPSGTYDVLDSIAAMLKYAYEMEWFPASTVKPQVVTRTDYDMLVEDAERCLRDARRRERNAWGLPGEGDEVIADALREMGFRDCGKPVERRDIPCS